MNSFIIEASKLILMLVCVAILFTPIIIIIVLYIKRKGKNNISEQNLINEKNEQQTNEMPSIQFNEILDNYSEETTEETAEPIQIEKFCPYERKFLLTKNEWAFYKKLKTIADKHNLHILSKVRMEDLIQVKNGLSNSEKASARGRIKSRHIDFVIAKPENLQILLAIELDDGSHKFKKIQEVDNFKNNVFKAVGLPYIRTYGNDDIEKLILEKINSP